MPFPLRSLLLALALLLGGAPSAAAQIGFGVAGGLNFSTLGDVAGANLESNTGLNVSAIVDIGTAPIGLRLGVGYVGAGTIEPEDVEIPDPTGGTLTPMLATEFDAQFISIPIELHYRFSAPLLTPYAFVGPELRFPIGDAGEDLEDATVSTAVAFNIGGGVTFSPPVLSTRFFAEIRYAFDASGLTDDTEVAVPIPGTEQTQRFRLESYQVNLFLARIGVLF